MSLTTTTRSRVFEYDLRTSQRQAHFARFGHARHMVLFARADRRQYPVCFGSGQFQLLDVGQAQGSPKMRSASPLAW